MLISYSHKFIFIHVYKTGGTSIASVLKPYAFHPERLLVNRLARKLGQPNLVSWPFFKWRVLPNHSTCQEIRTHLPPDIFNSSFKFAFVRNPWDWQVSLYHYILSKETHHHHREVRELGGFEEYLAWHVDGRKQLQLDFLVDEERRLLVDFVGKFEQIEADFCQVCRRLGLNITLPHLNASAHKRYTEYYTAKTRKLIAQHFAEDIDYFGYTFD